MTISSEYKKELQALHKAYEWGSTAGKYAGESVVNLLKTHPEIETILDYGCGEGTLKDYVEEFVPGKKWTLYDPGMVGFQHKPSGKFDLVITTDVLEHVEAFMTRSVLKELRQYTGTFLYNEIACYLTGNTFNSGPYVGQDLHINLKVPDEWKALLAELGMEPLVSQVSLLEGWKVRYLSVLRKANESSNTSKRRDS